MLPEFDDPLDIEEVAEGVFKLKIPIPNTHLRYSFVYILKGEQQCAMVDSAWNSDEAFNVLTSSIAKIGVKLRDIETIVVTHAHPDHYGLAGKIKRISGCQVVIQNDEAALAKEWASTSASSSTVLHDWMKLMGVPESDIRRFLPSLSNLHLLEPEPPDVTLRDGETLTLGSRECKVIATPGHSPGHICLYSSADRILLTGDHILANTTPHIGQYPSSERIALQDYLLSLDKLHGMDVNLVLPGHEFTFKDLELRIKQLHIHHAERLDRVMAALADGPKTVFEIASRMPWSLARWDEMAGISRLLAISETFAHVKYLIQRDQLKSFNRDGNCIFAQVLDSPIYRKS